MYKMSRLWYQIYAWSNNPKLSTTKGYGESPFHGRNAWGVLNSCRTNSNGVTQEQPHSAIREWEGSGALSPPGEEVPAILLPVVLHDLLHALLAGGQDGEPGQHCPQPVLLSDVVGACGEPQH